MIVDANKIKNSVGIIGESIEIEEMCTLIGQVANTDISVLISGESGSGKEMVAQALHKNSKRKFESMITVNCAAIPSGIIESELFGHKKDLLQVLMKIIKVILRQQIKELYF